MGICRYSAIDFGTYCELATTFFLLFSRHSLGPYHPYFIAEYGLRVFSFFLKQRHMDGVVVETSQEAHSTGN